jgi:hypothetical protein
MSVGAAISGVARKYRHWLTAAEQSMIPTGVGREQSVIAYVLQSRPCEVQFQTPNQPVSGQVESDFAMKLIVPELVEIYSFDKK